MANVLYVDDDDVAITVMSNFLKRSGDVLRIANTADEAWDLLCKSAFYDIIFLETKLESGNASGIVNQIKNNPYMSKLPIVIYTKDKKKEAVRKMTELDVQNYLYKPYRESVIKEEIDKAMKADWRIILSTDPTQFYRNANEEIDSFYKQNTRLFEKMKDINQQILSMTCAEDVVAVKGEIQIVAIAAESASYTSYSNMLLSIIEKSVAQAWGDIQPLLPFLVHAEVLQEYRIALLEIYFEDDEDEEEEGEVEEVEVAESHASNLEQKHTHLSMEENIKQITEYPVVESAAATFTMMVNDPDVMLEEIVKLVGQDSGLAMAVLKFSNSPVVAASSPSEDIERAVSVIGVKRVRTLATSLRTISELAPMFTAFKWQDFWMHQVGCAMLSEFVFEGLRLPGRSDIAYLGGLVHDIGKLMLCEIDPEGYAKVVVGARESNSPLAECEKQYFTCDHCEAGLIFAESSDLPDVMKNVMAHSQNPSLAVDHVDIIGCISIANYLCMKYQVGNNGDHHLSQCSSITDHPSWELLQRWIPPSFKTHKFVQGIEKRIFKLKTDLAGLIEN